MKQEALFFSGRRGRPSVDVSVETLSMLAMDGYSAHRIAELIGCSQSLVYSRLYNAGVRMRDRYSLDSDKQLTRRVRAINKDFPNSGSVVNYVNVLLLFWFHYSYIINIHIRCILFVILHTPGTGISLYYILMLEEQ